MYWLRLCAMENLMKSEMKSVLCWMGALACCGNLLWAEETPSSKTPAAEKSEVSLEKQIRVQVEFIEVPHEQLTEFLFAREVKMDASSLRNEVQELVKQGKAKVVETMACVSTSGKKVVADSQDEFIFPTEYSEGFSEGRKAARSLNEALTPTAFETVKLGNMLEIEPMLNAAGSDVVVSFTPEIRSHTEDVVWFSRKEEAGNVRRITMPRFYVLKLHGKMALKGGKHGFYAALSPKDDKGKMDESRKIMVFVKADVLESK